MMSWVQRRSAAALVAAVALGASACSSVLVTSAPAGARILIDGKDTGEVTPAKLGPELFEGHHSISVAADGFQSPTAKAASKRFGFGRLVSTILLPVPFLIVNLARGFYSMEPDELMFTLTPASATDAAAAAAPPPVPVAAAPPSPAPASSASRPGALVVPAGRFGKMAVLPTQFDESSKGKVPALFDDYVLAAVQNTSRAEVIGQEDIAALLGFEAQRDLMNCDETSCMADIGGALGVDRIVVVKIASLGDQWVATAKIIDIRNTRVESRVNQMVPGSVTDLLGAVQGLVHELLAAALRNAP